MLQPLTLNLSQKNKLSIKRLKIITEPFLLFYIADQKI